MRKSFSVRDIEKAGSMDNYFIHTNYYKDFIKLAEKLRSDEKVYKDLPVVQGARYGVNNLSNISMLKLVAYLSARPSNLFFLTKNELIKQGFPDIPIILRDLNINFYSSVEWKVQVLKELSGNTSGYIINIDDNPELAFKLRDNRNKNLVIILFKGHLTNNYVNNNNIQSIPEEHFYVAKWIDIPEICLRYTPKKGCI